MYGAGKRGVIGGGLSVGCLDVLGSVNRLGLGVIHRGIEIPLPVFVFGWFVGYVCCVVCGGSGCREAASGFFVALVFFGGGWLFW